MSHADQLRTAAERLRTLTEAATPGPWHVKDEPSDGIVAYFDAEGDFCLASHDTWRDDAYFIAAMDPNVARLLADWLEAEAEYVTATCERADDPALALAVYVNGRTQ